MPKQHLTRQFLPNAFCPTISATGQEENVILSGENMWIRASRFGTPYAEGYTGNLDLSETIATKTLTGTLAWTANSTTITGTTTAFLSEIRIGCFVLGDGGAALTQLFVVEKVVSNTSFICSRAPTASASGKTGYVMPVLFPVGTDRGTAIRGNVLQFPTGHYLGVGDGTFRVNGTALSATLALSTLPQFALYNPTAGTYTQDDVGIDKPLTPITIAAVTAGANYRTVSGATNATPIVITTGNDHLLHTGQEVIIVGVGGNTAANGTWFIKKQTATTFALYSDATLATAVAGNGAYTAGGTITGPTSTARAGGYNIRIVNKSTSTLGFSQPSEVIAPVTLTANQWIRITFNSAMITDQDAYDIYGTPFEDHAATTIEKQYQGPWFYVKTVTATNLITNATTTGRETATTHEFTYTDAEISTLSNLLTFNNFNPIDAEFVDLTNGIPIYFSCLGKGNANKTSGTSPGPAAIPSKPSNVEAIFKNKAITTAGGDYILGEFNAKSRIYVLCQNTLQTLILTTLDDEPVAFRSLWNAGFRNPYNLAFVKEYLYGFSTQKIVRSVAGGDDSAMEFEFASDIREYIVNWKTGHVLVAYCPKNRAVVFFYAAAERRSNYWVTIALPFMVDKGVWNPPIVLKKTNTDFIVSGVATIGEKLYFLAGGRTSGGSVSVGTYEFDGGDSETKDWYLGWTYSDSGQPWNPKTVTGFTTIGKFTNAQTRVDLHGVIGAGTIDITGLADNTASEYNYVVGQSTTLARQRFRELNWKPYSLWTMRMSGNYTTVADRLDKLEVEYMVEGSKY